MIKFVVKDNVVGAMEISKGEHLHAMATCNAEDEFSVRVGKYIAAYRIELMQRKRDLAATRCVIRELQTIIKNERDTKMRFTISKHWDHFLAEACREKETQLFNIRFVKQQLQWLTSGDKELISKALSVKKQSIDE